MVGSKNNVDAVKRLKEYGFTEKRILEALDKTKTEEEALEYLLNHAGDSQEYLSCCNFKATKTLTSVKP